MPYKETDFVAYPPEGIATLEHARERDSKGTYEDVDSGKRIEAEFNYKEYSSSALSILEKADLGEHGQELFKKYESLGLQDIAFNIFSKSEDFKEDLSNSNVYVLLHGWTANKDIYSEVHMSGGLSVAEQIMAMDENAVVIVPDGNGFGNTKFRRDVSSNSKFGEYCTAEAYAKQMDFLIQDVLKIDPDKVTVMGHSMGGAATYELMRLGYNKGVAVAPAAFPSSESIKDTKEKLTKTDPDRLVKSLAEYGINLSALIYEVIGKSVNFGEGIRKLGGALAEPLVKGVVSKIFEVVTPYLMGKNVEGIDASDAQIIENLTRIHANEVTPEKYRLVSEAIHQLGEGVNYEDWTDEELEKVSNAITFSGTEDLLVQPEDLKANNLVKLIKAFGTSYEATMAKAVRESQQEDHQVKGGHYAPVYNSRVIAAAVKLAKE